MHQQPIAIYSTCARCNCRVKVTRNREAHVTYCNDCLELMRLEQKRQRATWRSQCTYHMIYDPDNTWDFDCWLGRSEITECITNFEPGTRFDARGTIYEITIEHRLEKVGQH